MGLLLVMSISGLILQVQGFLNDDEESGESSPTKIATTVGDLNARVNLEKASAALAAKSGSVPLKKIEIDLRSNAPTLTFFTDEASPREIQMESGSFKIISEKSAASEFWMKLHSGEIIGDIGRALGIFGGLSLLFLTLSGSWIYLQMYRRRPAAAPLRKKFFW